MLIDEMKVVPYTHFNRTSMEFTGFVNLGKYTPLRQKNKAGDHALVFMFQPFRGEWVQAIGSFSSLNAASGTVLAQLVLEACVLLENAGFSCEGVVSDGASWNRAMWREFGASPDAPYCIHPSALEAERKFFFISDFPHLIKCLRNWVLTQSSFIVSNNLFDEYASYIRMYTVYTLIFFLMIFRRLMVKSKLQIGKIY